MRRGSSPSLVLDIDKDENKTVVEEEKTLDENISQAEWIALYIPPSLYLTASNLVIVDKLRRCTNSKFIISSTGLSAVMTALYAKYRAVQKVEWKMYSLSKQLDEDNIFSSSWKDELESFIDKEFEKIYFSDLKLPIVINLYDKSGTPKEFYKGLIAPVLKAAINIKPYNNHSFEPKGFKNVFANEYLDRIAKNWKILLNSHHAKFAFNFDRGFLWGKYSNISQALKNSQSTYYNTFNVENTLAIDDHKNLSRFFGKHYNQEQICQLLSVNKNPGSESSN